MDIDRQIEQLAFGKTTPKLSSCLGMYLSQSVIYLSEVHLEKGKPVVDHLVRIPLPEKTVPPGQAASATSLTSDFLADTARIQQLIRQAMSQMRWNSKNVIVTLSHHVGLLRYFHMPRLDRRFWTTAIPLEAKKYIPLALDALNMDHQVTDVAPGADGKPRQGVLVCVTPRKNVPSITTLLDGLGLNLLGLEVAPCSALRMWSRLDGGASKEPFCQVHFDGGNVRVLIADQNMPVFFREVFLGADALAQDSRKVDLAGCLAFAQKQFNVGKLTQTRLSGTTSDMERWKDVAARETGVPAAVHDTAGMLGIKGGDWGGYSSIGAALRFLAPNALTMDLTGAHRISEADKKTVKLVFLAAGLVSLLLMSGGLYRRAMCAMSVRELSKYNRDPEVTEAFKNKKPEEIERLLADMKLQADALQYADPKTAPKMTELIREVTSALPEKCWLTDFNLVIPPRGDEPQLIINGHATGASAVEEQDLSFAFRDQLRKTRLIGKIFADIQVSVDGGKTPQGSGDQENYRRALEERTAFHIVGRRRAK